MFRKEKDNKGLLMGVLCDNSHNTNEVLNITKQGTALNCCRQLISLLLNVHHFSHFGDGKNYHLHSCLLSYNVQCSQLFLFLACVCLTRQCTCILLMLITFVKLNDSVNSNDAVKRVVSLYMYM